MADGEENQKTTENVEGSAPEITTGRRVLRVIAVLFMCFLIFCAGSYLFMNRLYDGRFGYGTWVGGIYATGLRPSEVTAILDEQMNAGGGLPAVVMLIGRDDHRLAIPTEELQIRTSYAASVKKVYDAQNPLTWLRGILGGVRYTVTPKTSFDLAALENAIDQWEIFDGTEEEEKGVSIERTSAGYRLVMQAAVVPLKEEMIRAASEKISGGEYFVSLDMDGNCYDERPVTDADRSVLATWAAIEETRLPSLSYLIGGEQIPLDASVTDGWLLTGQELHALTNGAGNPAAAGTGAEDKDTEEPDVSGRFLVGGESVPLPEDARDVNGFAQCADGKLIFKEEEITAFVDSLCDRYDTLDKERDFVTADGRTVRVPAGTYGNRIDRDAEVRWLTEAVKTRASEEHTPTMLHEARQLGDDDIGGTYIEVDIGKQMLYYFVNGRIDTQIPVVTGNHSRRCDTPPGVYDIYFMQRNRTLRGEGYVSFVHYWMAFYEHYGIHDATWRGDFGDEIYLTSGSHGCVNIPLSEAGPLYQKLSVGVPVIVHE